jgi:hypothetical protein
MLLVVLSFAAKLLITNNPFGARAAFTSDATSCTLTGVDAGSLDYIPAECENKDVTINGLGATYTVYADTEKVFQTGSRGVCNGAGVENCDSKRIFKSLTLKGSALLTHHNVVVSDIDSDNDITNNTDGSGRWKKVDIELTGGDLKLEGSATINVDGAGYPGGGSIIHPDGYGPNGGWGVVEPNEGKVGANGGGNWGDGGRGYCHDNGAGGCDPQTGKLGGRSWEGINPDQANKGTIDFSFGSGGGHANQLWNNDPNKINGANGGAGGGRIRVSVNGDIVLETTSNTITARGAASTVRGEGTDEWELSGAGAGGSILLYAKNFSTLSPNPLSGVYNASSTGGKIQKSDGSDIYEESSNIPGGLGWDDLKYGIGSDGLSINDTATTIITNINVNGGTGYYQSDKNIFSGAGGGGQLVLSDGRNQFTIKKKLEPIDRPGGEVDFNPYALRVNDTIKITITVTNITAGRSFRVSDDFLKTSAGTSHKCAYVSGSESPTIPSSPAESDTAINWPAYLPTATDESLGYKDFSYYCKVR